MNLEQLDWTLIIWTYEQLDWTLTDFYEELVPIFFPRILIGFIHMDLDANPLPPIVPTKTQQ